MRYAFACALALCAVLLPAPARGEAFNVTDSALQAHASAELPPHARFVVRQVAGENFSGPKIARMLQMQMARQGYTHDPASPELVVAFGFDTVRPDLGQSSQVAAAFEALPRSEFVFDPIHPHHPPDIEKALVTDTRRVYVNTLVVRVSAAAGGETLWQGVVTETGWCNAPVLMGPRMLSLMFEGFPAAKTASRTQDANGEREQHLLALFPQGFNWDCHTIWHGRMPPR